MLFDKSTDKVIKFEQNPQSISIDNKEVLFVKIEHVTSGMMLEVSPKHCAFLATENDLINFYDSGTYTIAPSSHELSFGQKTFYNVIYIAKESNISLSWSIPEKIEYRDPVSNKSIELSASGTCRIKGVSSPRKFAAAVAVNEKRFDLERFKSDFISLLIPKLTDALPKAISENGIPHDQIVSKQEKIGELMLADLNDEFEDSLGISLAEICADIQASPIDTTGIAVMPNQSTAAPVGTRFCTYCGRQCQPNAAFCSACGKPIAIISTSACPRCNTPAVSNAIFCTACGYKLK